MYSPRIRSANPLKHYPLGSSFKAVLLGDIKSLGSIEYLYVLAVYEGDTPCLFVSSEKNAMAKELGGASHFLCVFQGGSHLNMGDSDDWAVQEKFEAKALEIAKESLGLE